MRHIRQPVIAWRQAALGIYVLGTVATLSLWAWTADGVYTFGWHRNGELGQEQLSFSSGEGELSLSYDRIGIDRGDARLDDWEFGGGSRHSAPRRW